MTMVCRALPVLLPRAINAVDLAGDDDSDVILDSSAVVFNIGTPRSAKKGCAWHFAIGTPGASDSEPSTPSTKTGRGSHCPSPASSCASDLWRDPTRIQVDETQAKASHSQSEESIRGRSELSRRDWIAREDLSRDSSCSRGSWQSEGKVAVSMKLLQSDPGQVAIYEDMIDKMLQKYDRPCHRSSLDSDFELCSSDSDSDCSDL